MVMSPASVQREHGILQNGGSVFVQYDNVETCSDS